MRFKLFELFEGGKGYFGIGGFYEHINYTSAIDPQEEQVRISSYFAYTIKLGDDSDLSYSLFYQPQYDKLEDYITSHKANIQLHVYKALFLNLSISWDIDNNPPQGVKENDFSQETTFVFKF